MIKDGFISKLNLAFPNNKTSTRVSANRLIQNVLIFPWYFPDFKKNSHLNLPNCCSISYQNDIINGKLRLQTKWLNDTIREIKNNPYVFFKVLSNMRNHSFRITISKNGLVSLSNTNKGKIRT